MHRVGFNLYIVKPIRNTNKKMVFVCDSDIKSIVKKHNDDFNNFSNRFNFRLQLDNIFELMSEHIDNSFKMSNMIDAVWTSMEQIHSLCFQLIPVSIKASDVFDTRSGIDVSMYYGNRNNEMEETVLRMRSV